MNIYSQLVEIVGTAVFGADAVLSANQTFILEELCLFMAFAVTLLPVIAIVAITVKLLKW